MRSSGIERQNISFHLLEAIEDVLEIITSIIESDSYLEVWLAQRLDHVMAHLNQCWNLRNLSLDKDLEPSEWRRSQEFPSDLQVGWFTVGAERDRNWSKRMINKTGTVCCLSKLGSATAEALRRVEMTEPELGDSTLKQVLFALYPRVGDVWEGRFGKTGGPLR